MSNVRTKGNAPVNKVIAGTAGAAVATVFVWILGLMNVQVPQAVEAAFATIVVFLASWLTPPGEREAIIPRPMTPAPVGGHP